MNQVSAMPQQIGDFDFNLNDVKHNKKLCSLLDERAESPFSDGTNFLYNDLPVLKSGCYYYARNPDGTMPYIIKTEVKTISAVRKQGIIQRALWRDQTSIQATNLASTMFYSVLLEKFGLVVSDCMQTEGGRRFWQLRLIESLKKGHHCYFLQAQSPRVLRELNLRERSFEDRGKIWGEDPKFKSHWLLISADPLTPKDDVEFEGN